MSNRETAAPDMAIEQMFEDIPNRTYSSPLSITAQRPNEASASGSQKVEMVKHQDRHNQAGHGHKGGRPTRGRNKVVKSGSEGKGVTSATSKVVQKPASDHKGNRHEIQNLSGSKSAEEAGTRRARRTSTSQQLDRMTPTTAIAMFGIKLTPYERNEIKEFHNIYFMGLTANKIGVGVAKFDQAMYDDNENFYKVVPRDHISYRYEVAEKPNLGKGTFGQVVKAYDHKDHSFVALKLVRNERIYLKQAREELRILQVLRKQDPNGFFNVVLMKDFFMFRNHMVIVFELLGMNLYQVISKNGNRGLPMVKILPIARGILKCLELLFKNRIIHCDLKPENIMLRKNGELGSIKVGDFGSSCYEQQQVYHYIQSRYYRAPEVILGMRYGPAIDMWSLGCVLGELSTGCPLFMGNNENDQLVAIEEVMGEIPKAMLAKSTKFKEGLTSMRSGNRGPPGAKQLDSEIGGDDPFKDLIAKILTLDPNLRPTPMELQDHPWLAKNRSLGSSNSRTGGLKQEKKTPG